MGLHRVRLIFEDGTAVALDVRDGERVYDAALRERIKLQSDCLEGACGTCKALCTAGEFSLDDYSDEALSATEQAAGHTLLCRMRPSGDCVVELPYDAAVAAGAGPPPVRRGRVTGLEQVAASVVRLDVELSGAAPLSFLPGQYAHLKVPGTTAVRSYSFANPPDAGGALRFYVKRLALGTMSEYVSTQARAGDEIEVCGPFGQFYLRPPRRPILMVAGGTGLAPLLSMLDVLAGAAAAAPSVHLLYGAGVPAELFAGDQLESVRARGLRIAIERAVLSPDPQWTGATGHITGLLRDELVNGGDCDAYLCGPLAMVEAARLWLSAHGVAPARIHAERFVPS